MENYYLTCHVEPTTFGDISYLRRFLSNVGTTGLPVILLLMVGAGVEGEILEFFRNNLELVPKKCFLGVHVHGGETEKAIKLFKKYFGYYPKLISFGHWRYTPQDLEIAQKFGVEKDFSYAAAKNKERFFLKKPFKNGKIWQYPVACDPRHPVNPFTYWYGLLLTILFVVIKRIAPRTVVHIGFHSYDWTAKNWPDRLRLRLAIIVEKKLAP